MRCPQCGEINPIIEYITNDVVRCECGYADDVSVFEVRTQKKEIKRKTLKGHGFDDEEE